MFTPYNNYQKDSNAMEMSTSGYFQNYNINNSSSFMPKINSKIRFNSLLAIGNPIVDISAEVTRDILTKYNLKFGETVFANQYNDGFFQELENMPQVTYIPGGSIQNTLRVTALCLNMEPNKAKFFKLTMLGATGNDNYRNKIKYAFEQLGVQYILEIIPNVQTSRCGVGIHQKERCLLPQIRASNCITEKFIEDNEDQIFKHDALLIEGYFLQEKYELCLMLCNKFNEQRKLVILTLSAITIVTQQNDKIIEISNKADIIVGNMAELEALADNKNMDYKTTFEKVSRKLRTKKDRLFVITNGNKGVVVGKYDYTKGSMDFIFQCFPTVMKMEEIVDLNGAGDAFLGGFLSQYMRGKSLEACCKAGNDAASIILKNIGCTFPKTAKIQFKE